MRVDDALRADPGRLHMVLTNPPFGCKSSVRMVNAEGDEEREELTIVRDDFWVTTSNKQLAFVQHVKSLLRINRRAASDKAATKKLWIYDLRTNQHFTLKTNPLARKDLDEFVACYHPANRHERKATWSEKKSPTGRWRAYEVEELLVRDKASLDVFWLKDEALEASANLPAPHVIAAEIVEDLRAALEAFEGLEGVLKGTSG